MDASPKLILVPTPIGNLGDITLRAIETLKAADIILAEDTRKTGILLNHLGISKKMISFHQANEHKKIRTLIDLLKTGNTLAMVSDAGTPGISDPGYLLVSACIEEGIGIECLPGPVAFVPALILSGLPTEAFIFEGFLPHKKGRMNKLKALSKADKTVVFYESPHRLLKTLEQMKETFGADRRISVSREISKKFEETIRGSIAEAIHQFETGTVKGEFVIVVEGNKQKNPGSRQL